MYTRFSTQNTIFFIFIIVCSFHLTKIEATRTKTVLNLKLTEKTNKISDSTITWDSQKQFFYAYGPCSASNCKMPYGECATPNSCACVDGYAQPKDQDVNNNNQSCTYELKEQYIAFLLEFLLWVGAGHFYSGRITNGAIKAAFIFSVFLFDCVIKKLIFLKRNKNQSVMNTVAYVLYFIILFWQIFDIIMFGLNKYNDGNGMPLHTWDTI